MKALLGLLLAWTLPQIVTAARKYWVVSFLENVNISTVTSAAGLTTVSVLQQNASYLLQLQLADSSGSGCASCSEDYAAIGGNPVLDLYRENPALQGPELYLEKTEFSSALNAWYIPITTRDAGSFIVTVTGNAFGSLAFHAGHASATNFLLSVTWIPTTRAASSKHYIMV